MARTGFASVIALVAFSAVARADNLPITLDPAAIDGSPKIKVQSAAGGKATMAQWRKDSQNRSLFLMVLEPKSGARVSPKLQPLFDAEFKEGITTDKDEADVREEGSGRIEIWGGSADWMMGSERAEMMPTFDPSDTSSKAPRGDVRRYCVQFVWKGDVKTAIAGSYCQQPTTKPTAGDLLEALKIKLLD